VPGGSFDELDPSNDFSRYQDVQQVKENEEDPENNRPNDEPASGPCIITWVDTSSVYWPPDAQLFWKTRHTFIRNSAYVLFTWLSVLRPQIIYVRRWITYKPKPFKWWHWLVPLAWIDNLWEGTFTHHLRVCAYVYFIRNSNCGLHLFRKVECRYVEYANVGGGTGDSIFDWDEAFSTDKPPFSTPPDQNPPEVDGEDETPPIEDSPPPSDEPDQWTHQTADVWDWHHGCVPYGYSQWKWLDTVLELIAANPHCYKYVSHSKILDGGAQRRVLAYGSCIGEAGDYIYAWRVEYMKLDSCA
jgi:hypothetical protein